MSLYSRRDRPCFRAVTFSGLITSKEAQGVPLLKAVVNKGNEAMFCHGTRYAGHVSTMMAGRHHSRRFDDRGQGS